MDLQIKESRETLLEKSLVVLSVQTIFDKKSKIQDCVDTIMLGEKSTED